MPTTVTQSDGVFRGIDQIFIVPLSTIVTRGCSYVASAFISDNNTKWTQGISAEGEIWLNPALKTSTGWENIVPAGWTKKALPDGTDW